MKLKRIALLGAAAVAALSFVACGKDSDKKTSKKSTEETSQSTGKKDETSKGATGTGTGASTGEVESTTSSETQAWTGENPFDILNDLPDAGSNGRLDIDINYKGQQGVSIREDSYDNPVEKVTYKKGDITPTFKRFAELTGTTIYDASDYNSDGEGTESSNADTNNYESFQNPGETIDLLNATVKNIDKFGAAGKAVNLMEHLDEMPFFSAWLADHESIKDMISNGNAIYYTPYCDGFDYIEKMLIMDHNMTKAVLDSNSTDSFDTTKSGKNGASNTLPESKYQPFIDANYNYATAQTIEVSAFGTKKGYKEIKVAKVENIIKQQNALLANGCTGKELADQFRTYLNAAYAAPLADGTYTKLSDIFLSEQAAYNADELIALMRVVKANPGVVTGNPEQEVQILTPRGAADNRVENILHFAQIWGVQGLCGETDRLYFDANGKLNDAASTPASYEALDYLQQIYDEGLIIDNFSLKDSTVKSGTYYLDKYFAHKKGNGENYAFMMYDYNASTSAANLADENKVGIAKTDLENEDIYTTGVGPIISPITWWANNTNYDHDQALSVHTNKQLMRFSEDNRILKTSSWMIPSNSDNITGAIKMMDIMFSTLGSWINNFGPEQYWATTDINEMEVYAGEKTPTLSAGTYEILAVQPSDMWSDLRQVIGATHGIGNVRPASMNYQGISEYAKPAAANVDNAVASKQFVLALSNPNKGYAMAQSVPTAGYGSIGDENAKTYDAVSGFWNVKLAKSTDQGWTLYVQLHDADNAASRGTDGNPLDSAQFGTGAADTSASYTWADVKTQRYTTRLSAYLFEYATNLGTKTGKDYIPSYLK